jgi:ATP synthase subunit 6
MISPLIQFTIYEIYYNITNLTYYVIQGYIIIIINNIIYSKSMCYLSRALIDSIFNITINIIGIRIEIYYVIIYSSMILITTYNLIGLMPYAFTVTSHYSITISMSINTILSSTILGIIRNTYSFLILFLPKGTPIILAPLLIIIELISYLARTISLGLRLGANLFTGHSLMLILSAFTIYPIISIPLIILLLILYIMEFSIAILQAYVYILLSNYYINDTIYLHN